MSNAKPDLRYELCGHGEAVTGGGQLLSFEAPPEKVDDVRSMLKECVRQISMPETHRVNVSHGGYGRYTRYIINQHKYVGGHGGYIEVLTIKNPPDGRHGIVLYEHISGNHPPSCFTEWETLKDAEEAFERYWGNPNGARVGYKDQPGFIRLVDCNLLTPWFYAIGDQILLGDYAFPEGLIDDPVYTVGKQFVVFDRDGVPSVKTCMGTRIVKRPVFTRQWQAQEVRDVRLVHWDDGTIWDESKSDPAPRLLEEGEMWITEALAQFRQLLTGNQDKFEIKFTDGGKFVGKFLEPSSRSKCPEGRYYLVASLKGKNPGEGWLEFKPTKEHPDVIEYARSKLEEHGEEVEHIEIKEKKVKRGGRKWSGAFFGR